MTERARPIKDAWRSPAVGAALIILMTMVAYLPALHCGFVWDDDDHFTKNPAMLSADGLKQIWSSLPVSRYYPLTLTSFWVQRRLWGLHPLPYHAVNIAMHACNAVLLWALLRRLAVRGAWLAAAMWALHPVNVESVAWITELKNTQSVFFFILSMLCFLRFDAQKRHGWYALAIASGLAAMLSKPSTVVLPLVLLLCEWWERGRWKRMDIVRIAPFFGLAVGMSVLTIIEQRGHVLRAGTTEWQMGPAERLVVAGKAIWFYAAKVLWPARLTFVYPRWVVDASSLWSWLPTVALVAVGVTLWRSRSRAWCRAVLFGGGFFVVALLPVLGFFDVFYFRYSFVADHFQYLACIGLISLAVSTGAAICARAGQRGRDLGTLAAAIVLLIFGASTWRQARIYQDPETLWRDTIAKNPQGWLGHNNLAEELFRQGRVPEATAESTTAFRLKPDAPETISNLGYALLAAGKVDEAIRHFKEAVRLQPGFVEAYVNWGAALVKMGKPDEAIRHYEEALRINPDDAEAHYNLGVALEKVGRGAEAIDHYQKALRTNPDYVEAHVNLGNALLRMGKVQEAVGQYEQALRIKPDYAEAHSNLGAVYQRMGKLPEAVAQYEQALRSKPDYVEAHYNLGLALEKLGRTSEAIEQYERALKLRPDFAPARNALTRLRAGQ